MAHIRVPTKSILGSLDNIESSVLNPAHNVEYFTPEAVISSFRMVGRDSLHKFRLLFLWTVLLCQTPICSVVYLVFRTLLIVQKLSTQPRRNLERQPWGREHLERKWKHPTALRCDRWEESKKLLQLAVEKMKIPKTSNMREQIKSTKSVWYQGSSGKGAVYGMGEMHKKCKNKYLVLEEQF